MARFTQQLPRYDSNLKRTPEIRSATVHRRRYGFALSAFKPETAAANGDGRNFRFTKPLPSALTGYGHVGQRGNQLRLRLQV